MAKRLLLVEDSAIIAMDTARRLSQRGYEVTTALSGEAAVTAATGRSVDAPAGNPPIDLVLMDIDLGAGIDGTEAARKILEKRAIPIVFLTGHSEQEMLDRVRQITRYGYVLKSSGDLVLASTIESAFDLFETEMELRDTRAELAAMYENAPIPILLADREMRVRRTNVGGDLDPAPTIGAALECVYALSLPNGCGSGPFCSICEVRQIVLTAFETGRRFREREVTVNRGKPGEIASRFLLATVVPLLLRNQLFVVASFSDTTEKKRLERSCAGHEERFDRLAEAVPVMIWESDETGCCVYFNEQWISYTGRSLEDEIGDGWLTGVDPDDREAVRRKYRSALAGRTPFELTYRLRGSDGLYRWVLDTGIPKFVGDREFAGYIGAASLIDRDDDRAIKEYRNAERPPGEH
ncbi:MAG: PAS domain S-box protein [Alkalispirochaeta sp.]